MLLIMIVIPSFDYPPSLGIGREGTGFSILLSELNLFSWTNMEVEYRAEFKA